MIEHNPAKIFDEQGRLLRWKLNPYEVVEVAPSCCGKSRMTQLDQDLLFNKKLENFHNQLYDHLEVSKRAIANWKKIRVLLVLLKLCGNKSILINQGSAKLSDEEDDVR